METSMRSLILWIADKLITKREQLKKHVTDKQLCKIKQHQKTDQPPLKLIGFIEKAGKKIPYPVIVFIYLLGFKNCSQRRKPREASTIRCPPAQPVFFGRPNHKVTKA